MTIIKHLLLAVVAVSLLAPEIRADNCYFVKVNCRPNNGGNPPLPPNGDPLDDGSEICDYMLKCDPPSPIYDPLCPPPCWPFCSPSLPQPEDPVQQSVPPRRTKSNTKK